MADSTLDIVHPLINQYLLDITPDRDSVLAEMESFAAEKNFPIIGPLVGRLLFTLARAINAKHILELGSGFGYSAYWFAKATADDCRILCTEGRQNNIDRGITWLTRGGLSHKVEFRKGNALEILAGLDRTFDIILNDIDKEDYPKALALAVPRLRTGGLLITDNVLWSGRILNNTPDEATAGILTFNRLVYADAELMTTVLPLRDGVALSIKL